MLERWQHLLFMIYCKLFSRRYILLTVQRRAPRTKRSICAFKRWLVLFGGGIEVVIYVVDAVFTFIELSFKLRFLVISLKE